MKIYSAAGLSDCGRAEGFRIRDDGTMALPVKEERGIFLSRVYSGAEEMDWDQLRIFAGGGASFRTAVLFFNDEKLGEQMDALEDVSAAFDCLITRAQIISPHKEVLLYRKGLAKHRYLRIGVEAVRGSLRGEAVFRGYEITFPKENFVSYLPGIFQGNEELERFMAVFQRLYLDLEERIEAAPEMMDVRVCPRALLLRLAGWLGYGEALNRLEEDGLRRLLQKGPEFARLRGTSWFYVELVRLLTGMKSRLLELEGKRECMLLLYEEPASWESIRFVEDCAPLGVTIRAVVLKKTDRLDKGCFLDCTAMMSEKECEIRPEGTGVDDILLM